MLAARLLRVEDVAYVQMLAKILLVHSKMPFPPTLYAFVFTYRGRSYFMKYQIQPYDAFYSSG